MISCQVPMLQYPAGISAAVAPERVAAAKIGAISSAPSISMPWKKSVQHTAEKPPRKV